MPPETPPSYTLYRSRPRLLGRDGPLRPGGEGDDDPRGPRRPGRSGRLRRLTWKRGLAYLIAAIVAWLVVSLAIFLISAQIHRQPVPGALSNAGFPLTSTNTILVLGSDARPPGSKEPGADPGGPSRSDTIMLIRIGGGHDARLSIPRDMVADIPGHGVQKINAAYAYGGAPLAVKTIEQFLPGVHIDHVIQPDFQYFPGLIDALGGVDVHLDGPVLSKISGGNKNGGYTLRLHRGEQHLNGKQALALARTRENLDNPAENDLTREKRQQQILSSMKSKMTSPLTFFRLPWVAWEAPKAIRTDMSGPSLLGAFFALETSSSPKPRILEPTGSEVLPDGGDALTITDAAKQAAVTRFLNG